MKPKNPQIKCKDGFAMSVQASDGAYCLPREDYPRTPYTHVECGYPSTSIVTEELQSFVQGDVYPYVPIEIVQAELDAHGGIVQGRLPNWSRVY